MALAVPPSIETVISGFERAQAPFTVFDVQHALSNARAALENPTESENLGAWAEVLAFSLAESRMQASPWGTYFAPMGTATDRDGNTIYFPEIKGADPQVVGHWAHRAHTTTQPVLQGRYADLVWDLCMVIAGTRRDPELARLAMDAYLRAAEPTVLADAFDRFGAAIRALDLAIMIHDAERIERARAMLLQLHHETMASHEGPLWLTFDRLIEEKNAGVTDAERQQLVDSLESLVTHFGDTSTPKAFDAHVLEDTARRLIRYYTRCNRPDEIRRFHHLIARAFEHAASQRDAMVGSAFLQTSVNAYCDAGMAEESKRVRVLMQEKIGAARDQMGTIQIERQISHDDMETFLENVVVSDVGTTLARIAAEFLPSRRHIEVEVENSLKQTPLIAMMPQKIMASDHVAATVGSVQDDLLGRILHHTTMNMAVSAVWLHAAAQRALKAHGLSAEHFAGWANRHGSFGDLTFLIEGVRASLEGDLAKSVHVLVPRIELGLRNIVGQLGKPVTKAHPKVPGVGVVIGMGDILYSPDVTDALGPDLALYFLALYADPRGMNLRNRVAHGLIEPESIDGSVSLWLLHTLLVLGIWKELAEKRR
jgi:lysyl-tRNA synthetase class 1